jgi:transcriptional regulator with XRE-family HTH domain
MVLNLGENIKKIRKERGLQQKEVAIEVGVDQSNYNKMENGKRDPSVTVLKKLADLFGVTVDYIIEPTDDMPKEVIIEDKTANEQLRLIADLDDDDKAMVFKMINKMLSNKKFKAFFKDNVDTL